MSKTVTSQEGQATSPMFVPMPIDRAPATAGIVLRVPV